MTYFPPPKTTTRKTLITITRQSWWGREWVREGFYKLDVALFYIHCNLNGWMYHVDKELLYACFKQLLYFQMEDRFLE